MTSTTADQILSAFETHYDELISFVRTRVRCPALAADIVQETYVRAVSGQTPPTIDNPRAFLYRVAGNLAIDHLRREQRRRTFMADGLDAAFVADNQPDAERAVSARQGVARLRRIVDELPDRCREVFVLRRFEGMDQKAIADRLGISRNMVEKHLRRALVHCTARLDEDD